MSNFRIFQGSKQPHVVHQWPAPPPWRRGRGEVKTVRTGIPPAEDASWFCVQDKVEEQVNAAIHLRRPLLVTGNPGTGKSSLARAIAHGLGLGRLLVWPINSRSTRYEGLYSYDAIRRVQDAALSRRRRDIGHYIRLGPLGTAMLPAAHPRVLLIDEIDKSDIDLPNDLLHVFEEGEFFIPELARDHRAEVNVRPTEGDGDEVVAISGGRVQCKEFPIVVLTSNGEREFSPAFRRRCICVTLPDPGLDEMEAIVRSHFKGEAGALKAASELIHTFVAQRQAGQTIATDQLLNAIQIRLSGGGSELDGVLLRSLTDSL